MNARILLLFLAFAPLARAGVQTGGGATGGGSGDVTAASSFAADNRMIRSDGTGKGVQPTGITIDDSDNASGFGTISGTNLTVSGGKFTLDGGATPSITAFGEFSSDNNLWASGRGALVWYDGTAATALVGVLVSDTPTNGQVPKWNTGGTITWEDDNTAAGGTGDASTNTSSSVDSEIAVFSGTAGKTLKRATGTGLARVASGVLSAAELSGDATTSGSNAVTVTKINGTSLAGLATGLLKNTTTTGVPSIATAADLPSTLTSGTAITNAALTTQVVTGGLTASGSGANDFSGSTGTFKTSTGAVTIGGATTINGPAATTALTLTQTARTSGALPYIKWTIPTDTGQTAATESPGLVVATGTRTWATTGTVALQRENFFAGPTYASASASQTFTDAFNMYLTPPIAGTNAIFTRGHTLGIVDSTSASSSITGGLVVSATLGTGGTSVGIGGGNVNAGGNGTFGGTLSVTGHDTLEGVTSTGATGTGKFVFDTSPTIGTPIINDGKRVLNSPPGSDDTYAGQTIIGYNGTATQWNAVYFTSGGVWANADATTAGTNNPARGIAVSTASSAALTVLTDGIFRDDGGTSWTVGGTIYLSTTGGALTQTKPATTGNAVQVIGYALAAHVIMVKIGTDYGTAP